jgi:hypothetical protein
MPSAIHDPGGIQCLLAFSCGFFAGAAAIHSFSCRKRDEDKRTSKKPKYDTHDRRDLSDQNSTPTRKNDVAGSANKEYSDSLEGPVTPLAGDDSSTRRSSKSPLISSAAFRQLESAGRINLLLSPSDNAVRILEAVLPFNLADTTRASIEYALEVLRSDSSHSAVPIGLQQSPVAVLRRAGLQGAPASRRSSVGEGIVLDWLMSSYTPTAHSPQVERLTFGAPRASAGRPPHGAGDVPPPPPPRVFAFVYDAPPEELERVEEALRGVDEWEWDVWRLRQVRAARALDPTARPALKITGGLARICARAHARVHRNAETEVRTTGCARPPRAIQVACGVQCGF